MNSSLYVRQLAVGPMKNFVYLLGSANASEVVVMDPAWDVDAIDAALREDGKRLAAAVVSHSHHDHINGLPELLRRHDVPVYAQKEEVEFSPELRRLGGVKALSSGDSVKVGPVSFKALHTPGHTPGSQCLLCCDDALVTGDTLFVHGCGRCDMKGGDPEAMHRSLTQVIMRLPDETRMMPGHDYGEVPVSSIGAEKQGNPYFQFPDLASFVAFRMRPRK
ncbi:MAG: MBL fold metallo-hydrolase [Myxococcaceae bacterium]